MRVTRGRMAEKRLAPPGLTCGRITVNGVCVAFHHTHGASRRQTRCRDVEKVTSRTVGGIVLYAANRALFFFLVLATMLVLICGIVPAAAAQTAVDDVHVVPRVEPRKADPTDFIDPSLKTHTKPLKVDVNLVLVSVTITDPMNRLVTGLDKENFMVFENKDQQDIRHFSSEDSPVSIGVIFDMSGSMAQQDRARPRGRGRVLQDRQSAG